jgi:hypothetical protein
MLGDRIVVSPEVNEITFISRPPHPHKETGVFPSRLRTREGQYENGTESSNDLKAIVSCNSENSKVLHPGVDKIHFILLPFR